MLKKIMFKKISGYAVFSVALNIDVNEGMVRDLGPSLCQHHLCSGLPFERSLWST